MYDEEFGTDWTSLSRDEAVERAFALGVAVSTGEEHPQELARLTSEVDGAYDRSMVKLAYEEGRNRARKRDVEGEEDVWEVMADEDGDEEPIEITTDPPSGIPEAVNRIGLLDPPEDDLDRIRLPGFLRRQ